MIGGLDRRLSRLDYRIGAAYGAVETAYALDVHEAHKEDAFLRLEGLMEERDALRRKWATPVVVCLEPGRRWWAPFGPGPDEIPVYDPESLVL